LTDLADSYDRFVEIHEAQRPDTLVEEMVPMEAAGDFLMMNSLMLWCDDVLLMLH